MSNSYSEIIQIDCLSCSQEFTTTVWHILDPEEEPELAELAGRWHLDLAECPHCGDLVSLGFPLLIFQLVGSEPIIIATVGLTEEKILTDTLNLLKLLRTHLMQSDSNNWRDEWLDSVAIVPMEELPGLLCEEDFYRSELMYEEQTLGLAALEAFDPKAYEEQIEKMRIEKELFAKFRSNPPDLRQLMSANNG